MNGQDGSFYKLRGCQEEEKLNSVKKSVHRKAMCFSTSSFEFLSGQLGLVAITIQLHTTLP